LASAKDIRIEPISRKDADTFVIANHYSGKVVRNSQLHLGAFIGKRLVGVAQLGPPMDRSKVIGLVRGTQWNEMLELNRLVLIDDTPANSESRFISIVMRLIKKHAPHIKWVLSFADGTLCGDGTIYRASGFVLTLVRTSHNLALLPDGSTVHKMTLESSPTRPRAEVGGRSYYDVTGGRYAFRKYVAAAHGRILPGFQLRYIYFIDRDARRNLTVPELPFSEIERLGAGMYRGVARAGSIVVDAPAYPAGEGGSVPTPALQPFV